MRLAFSRLPLFSSFIAISLAASAASASTVVSLTYQGASSAGDQKNVTIATAPVTYPGSGDWPKRVGAWGFNMEDSTGTLNSFLAWCLDVGSFLSGSATDEKSYTITANPFSNSYGLSPDEQARTQSVFDANYGTLDASNGNQAAAFQLSLWDAIYDNDFSVTITTGSFYASTATSSSILTLANTFLSNASTYVGDRQYNLTYLESNFAPEARYQNLVTVSPVPIPAAGGLLLLALGGIAVGSRRSKKAG